MILKGIIKEEDWQKFRPEINWEWSEDSYYREIKNSEMLTARLDLLSVCAEYSGRYFSMEWLKRNVLLLNDEEIRELQKEIDAEVEGGKLAKGATIEWGGDQGGEMEGEEPPPPVPGQPVPPQPGDLQPEELLVGEYDHNGNGSKLTELDHINTLEQILEEVGE